MTVKEYVDNVLCVPVTRLGNRFITEAIELILDTGDHKFYDRLSDILGEDKGYLENAIRKARLIGLQSMDQDIGKKIFGVSLSLDVGLLPKNTEYIIRSAEYYRRNYEDKTER